MLAVFDRDQTPTERGAAYPLGAYGSSLRGGCNDCAGWLGVCPRRGAVAALPSLLVYGRVRRLVVPALSSDGAAERSGVMGHHDDCMCPRTASRSCGITTTERRRRPCDSSTRSIAPATSCGPCAPK